MTRRRLFGVAGMLALLAGQARADLRADELLLITNSNVPQSAAIAKHYAQARKVPAERLLALNLPNGEDLSAEDYDRRIAAPVRAYLKSPAGKGVRCLVTFYGVPLRVGMRPVTEVQREETASLRRLLTVLDRQAITLTQTVEAKAKAAGLDVPDQPVDGVYAGRVRFQGLLQQLQRMPNPPASLVEAIRSAQQISIKDAVDALVREFHQPPSTQPLLSAQETQSLFTKPHDAAARATLRQQVSRQGGVFPLHQVAEQQLIWTSGEESDAAVDNELALVLFEDYAFYRWQPNTLAHNVTPAISVKQLMTCRIDAPTPQMAIRLINDTLRAEEAGLDGKVVFDSRGLPAMKDGKPDGYGWYDQAIRDAATFTKNKTKLLTITDDREQVLMPRTVPGTALYCGWYSLRNYIPGCGFVTGAVGFHVASLELVSLHDPQEKGWVANLIKDGVVATLGAVSEPYLGSFPRPEEFFPLLMTGKATIAEVYWATNPMTSWKNALIGDPLYRPFAKRPALKAEELPVSLRAWLEKSEANQFNGR